MAVDEFGREIRDSNTPVPPWKQPPHSRHADSLPLPDEDPQYYSSRVGAPIPSSTGRYGDLAPRDRSPSPHHQRRAGTGSGKSRGRSPDRDYYGSGLGRNRSSHHQREGEIIVPRKQRPAAGGDSASRIPRRVGRPHVGRSRSQSPPARVEHGSSLRADSYYEDRRAGDDRYESPSHHHPHPDNKYTIERYVQHPMLCQFLWQKEIYRIQQQQNLQQNLNEKENGETSEQDFQRDDKVTDDHPPTQDPLPEITTYEAAEALAERQDMEQDSVALGPVPQQPSERQHEHEHEISQETEQALAEEAYHTYNREYCTNVIRCFFNAHLDDEWFQLRYSPRHRVVHALRERERAKQEAKLIMDHVSSSNAAGETFLQQCRLGIGRKPQQQQANQVKRKYHDIDSDEQPENFGEDLGSTRGQEQQEEEEPLNPTPISHLLSSQDPRITVKVTHIPPNLSDAQLAHAFEEHCHIPPNSSGKVEKAVDRVCSTTVGGATTGAAWAASHYCESLDRTAWVVFVSEQAKETMLEHLHKTNVEAKRGTYSLPSRVRGGRDILELDVDCSDPFGRVEIDADGKGSAPPSERARSSEEFVPKVPIRKATVFVHATRGDEGDPRDIHNAPVIVLSAAVSSAELIPRNKTAALMIARALDRASSIPSGCKLDDLVNFIFGHEGESDPDLSEDVLDVAIAYLRRVHLFSFYTGQTAAREGDVLAGDGAAGTIHLRLQNADAMLKKAEEVAKARAQVHTAPSENPAAGGSDLRVQRLNEAISKAVEESTARLASMDVVVNAEVDGAAEDAQKDEELAKKQWLDDHSVLDTDGRARCAFHFCKKLFKDKHFLHKHLLKKHPEYLAGEQAKCHDKYMMQAWEKVELRPVPRIFVDCGNKFGLVKVALRGAQPIADDPEPALYRETLEKIRKEHEEREAEREARERERQRRQESLLEKVGFVDVDDMKEEVVELAFDQVEFPLPTKKKKKKKKLA